MRDCYTRMLNMNLPTYCVALLTPSAIDLVTVFDAILTNRQKCEKLQCLYENLMSNNFRTTAVRAEKNISCKLKLQSKRLS